MEKVIVFIFLRVLSKTEELFQWALKIWALSSHMKIKMICLLCISGEDNSFIFTCEGVAMAIFRPFQQTK